MITILFLTCILYAPYEVASGSIPGAPQHKSLHDKRQDLPVYSWEQSWNSQTNNQITTITTSTSGTIPPNTGFNHGATSTWTYQYSYSSSSDDSQNSGGFSGTSSSAAPGSDSSLSGKYEPGLGSSNTSPVSKPFQQGHTPSPPKPVMESPSKQKDLFPPPEPKYINTKSPGLSGSSDTTSRDDWTAPRNPRYSNSSPFSDTTNQEVSEISDDKGDSSHPPPLPDSENEDKGISEKTKGKERPTPSSAGAHQDWLDSHNNYRSQYGVKSLTWSEDLVESARSQVEKCVWKHTKHNKYGENIAAGQNSASEVVVAWVEGPNEREMWNPSSATPTHFTQVVWKDTEQIGCAFKSCENIEGSNLPQSPVKLWACEYHPKGNIGGEYVKNVLAAAGGKPLASAGSAAFASVDPDDPSRAQAGGKGVSKTIFSPAPE